MVNFMKSRYEPFDDESDYPLEDEYDDDNIPEMDLPSNSYYRDDYSDEYTD